MCRSLSLIHIFAGLCACGGHAADIGVCGFGLHDRERDARHLNRLEMCIRDSVKTGLHNQITYSFAESMFHLGSYRKKEKQMDEKAMELLRVFDPVSYTHLIGLKEPCDVINMQGKILPLLL